MSRETERTGRAEQPDNRDSTVRKERVPIHKQNIVTGTGLVRQGYQGYWQNDKPGAIDAMLLAGWEFVVADASKSHDGLSSVESPWGNAVRRRVNTDPAAESHYAYLMQIPKEMYDEDQAEQQKMIDNKEKGFDPTGHMQNIYGSFTKSKT
jgi:hypothetical protein